MGRDFRTIIVNAERLPKSVNSRGEISSSKSMHDISMTQHNHGI